MKDNNKGSKDQQGNVIIMDPNKMDVRSQAAPAGEKMKKIEVFKTVAAMMMGGNSQILPPFPVKFHVKIDKAGEHEYLEEMANQVLRPISTTFIIDMILQYCTALPDRHFMLKRRECREIFDLWSGISKRIREDVAPVRQLSTPGFCWHRLPFDLADGPTEVFDELMSRSSDPDAIMAWIGSLFIPESGRRQYLWIYGEGKNGKGALARFLGKCLENTTAEEDVPISSPREKVGQFWTNSIVGKRLVIFDDCDAYFFPSTGFFKKLTGGNAIRREVKNGPVIYTDLICKFLYTSNNKPEIGGSVADRTRAIYCTFGKIDKKYEGHENLLWDEAPAFLYKCVEKYREKTDSDGFIHTDTTALDELIESNEADYESFVETWISPSDNPAEFPMAKDMTIAMRSSGYSGESRRYLKRYLERKYGITYTAARLPGGKLIKRYIKCKLHDPPVATT